MNNSQNVASNNQFEKFSSGVRKTFSGMHFLVLTIFTTLLSLAWIAYAVFSALDGGLVGILLGVLSFVASGALTVSCWLLYFGSSVGTQVSNKYIKSCTVTKIYLMARTIISAIFLVAGILMITVIVDKAMDVALPEFLVFEEAGYSWLWAFASIYLTIFIVFLLVYVYVFIVAVFIIRAIRFHLLYKTLDNTKEALKSGYGFDFHPGTPALLSFVAAAVNLVGGVLCWLLGFTDIMMFGITVLSAMVMIMVGVLLYSAKANLAEYDALNSSIGAGSSVSKTVAKVFFLIGVVLNVLLVIPLVWCLPMLKRYLSSTKHGGTPISTGFKVCTLLLVSPIAGILMLCDKG